MLQYSAQQFISRRTMLRGSAMLGAGAFASTMPFASPAYASAAAEARWPGVTNFVKAFVDEGKVAGMVATLGLGQGEAETIAAGARTFGDAGAVGPDTLYRIYSMTKPVTIDARFTGAGSNPMKKVETIGFEGTATIMRSDFGVDYALPLVSDEVELTISAAFEKQ